MYYDKSIGSTFRMLVAILNNCVNKLKWTWSINHYVYSSWLSQYTSAVFHDFELNKMIEEKVCLKYHVVNWISYAGSIKTVRNGESISEMLKLFCILMYKSVHYTIWPDRSVCVRKYCQNGQNCGTRVQF